VNYKSSQFRRIVQHQPRTPRLTQTEKLRGRIERLLARWHTAALLSYAISIRKFVCQTRNDELAGKNAVGERCVRLFFLSDASFEPYGISLPKSLIRLHSLGSNAGLELALVKGGRMPFVLASYSAPPTIVVDAESRIKVNRRHGVDRRFVAAVSSRQKSEI